LTVCSSGCTELRRVEIRLSIHRGISGRQQEGVAFTEGYVQSAREQQDHVSAGPCPAGLDEAEVARRDLCFCRESELAHVTYLAPVLEQGAHRTETR
jgi:hypothetical protein